MLYTAKLKNYPFRWTVEAENEEEATAKAWEVISAELESGSVSNGGYIQIAPETYSEMRERQQKDINSFPFVFAFSEKQLFDGMREKWGYKPTDTQKITSIGAGGYIRKTDAGKLDEMLSRHRRELLEQIKADMTGDGFIYQMFDTELANHEYSYTHDITDALRAVGIGVEDINANKNLLHGLQKAMENQKNDF